MNSKLLIWSLLILVLFSCKRNPAVTDSNIVELSEFEIADIEFEDLSAKTKLRFETEESSVSATANIRIRKDSLIWFSLTPALGIEAARGIITQDSMVLVDRINKTYSIYGFEALSKKFNFNLNYHLIESLILGNSSQPLSDEDQAYREGTNFRLDQKTGSVKIQERIDGNTLKIENIMMLDEVTKNSLMINYSEFDELEQFDFPYEAILSLSYTPPSGIGRLNTQVNLDHNRVVIETKRLKFPFNIPSKYERKL
jgi:hypothetical protein